MGITTKEEKKQQQITQTKQINIDFHERKREKPCCRQKGGGGWGRHAAEERESETGEGIAGIARRGEAIAGRIVDFVFVKMALLCLGPEGVVWDLMGIF